jgi:hypothetical protein
MNKKEAYRGDGKITISRTMNNRDDENCISIEFLDSSSRLRIATISMNLREFAECLTGLAYQDCKFEVHASAMEYLGMVPIHKTIVVIPSKELRDAYGNSYKNPSKQEDIAREILAQYEVDGWTGYTGDLFNNHRSRQGGYSVTFHKYVTPEEAEKFKEDKP